MPRRYYAAHFTHSSYSSCLSWSSALSWIYIKFLKLHIRDNSLLISFYLCKFLSFFLGPELCIHDRSLGVTSPTERCHQWARMDWTLTPPQLKWPASLFLLCCVMLLRGWSPAIPSSGAAILHAAMEHGQLMMMEAASWGQRCQWGGMPLFTRTTLNLR